MKLTLHGPLDPRRLRLVFSLMVSCWLFGHVCGHVYYHRSHFTHLLQEERNAAKLQCVVRDGVVGRCVPPMQCPAHVQKPSGIHCSLRSGNTGVCCTTGQNHTDGSAGKAREVRPSLSVLQHIFHESERTVHDLLRHAQQLPALEHGTPSFGHFQNVRLPVEDVHAVQDQSVMALEAVYATRAYKEQSGLSNKDVLLGQMFGDLHGTGLDTCPTAPACPQSRYRNQDGTCNNLLRPRWGAAHSPSERVLPPRYSDGVWTPRESVVGRRPLPSARLLSTTLFPDHDIPHPYSTLLVMQFGQFIAHDVTLSPSMRHENGSGVSCCERDGHAQLPPTLQHFACFPVQIPADDPFYSLFDQRCMTVVRGMLAPRYDCSLGYAQQMNLVSHFVDGSAVYSSDPKLTAQLRSFEGGLLKVTEDFGRDLPPMTRDQDHCGAIEGGNTCFHSGDIRTNQMVGLVVTHLLFLREHNRLAAALAILNPHWSDEIIFQEARRVVIAEIQHILYSEWLPIVVGTQAMEDYGLAVTREEHSLDYDPNVNPSTTNEFSVAAFRFGHSSVDGLLKIMKQDRVQEQIFLPEVMFNPSRMRRREFYDRFLNMLITQPMQEVDVSVTQGLSNYMFRAGHPFGMDLVSINIQRGRDHGLGTYNDYRELAGIHRALVFEDFRDRFSAKTIEVLRAVYASPEDVDLFVGGLLEKPVPGALVGPTFLGIIADQFSRFKRGDRFFYENGDQLHSFTKSQLRELKKTTIAHLICENSDQLELHQLSMNPFLRRDHPGNVPLDCDYPGMPRMDLRFWKENIF